MEEKLSLASDEKIDGLSWYVATESFNSIINGLIAHYNVELTNIREERQTESYRLHCMKMLHEIGGINQDLSIFDSLEKMDYFIDKYGPLLKKLNGF